MPRSNRPRSARGRGNGGGASDEEYDIANALRGRATVESKRGRSFTVQQVPASTKTYVCPGCSLAVTPGTAHVVVWRADGLMGEADDLAARRHWHTHCWRIS
ncbi:hypothetical protein [Marisediminicola sp. LYQ134]|uniref:hypothetical protein n=1 Tax=unclassified Marisediminicola TaxID=2618316 RepID=UPI003982D95B